jgi:hypothetical protein
MKPPTVFPSGKPSVGSVPSAIVIRVLLVLAVLAAAAAAAAAVLPTAAVASESEAATLRLVVWPSSTGASETLSIGGSPALAAR